MYSPGSDRLTPELSCERSVIQARGGHADHATLKALNRNASLDFALVSCSVR